MYWFTGLNPGTDGFPGDIQKNSNSVQNTICFKYLNSLRRLRELVEALGCTRREGDKLGNRSAVRG
jgi:hypothetical protein